MQDSIFEFFRNHIKMAMYGMRCEIWANAEMPIDDQENISEDLTPVLTDLKLIDNIIEEAIIDLNNVPCPEVAFSMDVFDEYRRSIDQKLNTARERVDDIMSQDTMSRRLVTVALRRQAEYAKQAKSKPADTIATITGTPDDLGGADTVKLSKNTDGTAVVEPVTKA